MSSTTGIAFSPWRNRPFRSFLCAQVAGTIAYQMAGVAVGWHIYDLTRNPFDLGLVGLVQFIPSLLLVLYVGHAADRYDRRRIVSLAQRAESAALVGLAVAVAVHRVNRETILFFVFVIGTARAFEYTTLQTLVPSLVDPELLPQAMAANSSVRQASAVIGPVLGGGLYIIGAAAVYWTSCALLLVSAAVISRIRPERVIVPREPANFRTLFAGMSFVRGRPVVLGAISLDLFAVLLGGATALLPIFARDILHTGPAGLGFLRAAPAVGALSASLYLARHPLRRNVGRTMFIAVACFGFMTIVFALSRSFLLSLASLAILGGADMISVVIRASLVQLDTPDEMRGRVSALNAIFIGSSNQLGEFESGLTAAWFGVVPAALLGGIGTLAVVLAWTRLFPQLLNRERLQSG
jgi:MFS family permease